MRTLIAILAMLAAAPAFAGSPADVELTINRTWNDGKMIYSLVHVQNISGRALDIVKVTCAFNNALGTAVDIGTDAAYYMPAGGEALLKISATYVGSMLTNDATCYPDLVHP